MRILLFLTLACLAGAGCTTSKPPSKDPVEIALAKSFGRIADSMEALAQIEAARRNGEFSAANYTYDDAKLPEVWVSEITLVEDFHGDLERFIEMVSVVSGLNPPRVDTPRRGRPVIVAISKGKRKLISFVADAANQAGDGATLVPSIPLKTVVIKYEN